MFFLSKRFVRNLALAGSAMLLMTNQLHAQLQVSNAQYEVAFPQFLRSVSADSLNVVLPEDSAPFGEGISGVIGEDGLLSLQGTGQSVVGVEFSSLDSLLNPVPSIDGAPASPAPFTLLLSNTPNQVTLGNLGNGVTVDGSLKLPVGYNGTDPRRDLSAQWGRGAEAIDFPVRFQSQQFTTPFNLQEDGRPVTATNGVYMATIEAGSATGSPPDTPADRVDPNDATAQFPGVGSLEVIHPTLGTFICTGSVIDDTHILTAGHCFDLDNDGSPDAGITTSSKFYLNDGSDLSSTIDVASVDIHPDFGGFTSSGANDDLAVVTLDAAVPAGTTKYSIRTTGMSSGEVLEMVGYGISGQGDVGGIEVLPDLSVKRSGSNQADLFVVDDEGSGADEIYLYDFDGPTGDGFLGMGTLGNDIETGVRGGDSGGPAFVDEAGMKVIAGVNTFEFVLFGTTPPTGEFGVLGGGVLIDEDKFTWISSIAPGATNSVPEPHAITLLLPCLALLGLARRRSR